MNKIRTEREARKDLRALDKMARKLLKSHGLREYWASTVYYGYLTPEEAVKEQEENDRRRKEQMKEPVRFVTSIEEFDEVLDSIENLVD